MVLTSISPGARSELEKFLQHYYDDSENNYLKKDFGKQTPNNFCWRNFSNTTMMIGKATT
jgi:hypothetical protein